MTAKKASASKTEISKDTIISGYMDLVLTNEQRPKSVFKFCKDQNMKESDFYQFFGSFESLQKEIWMRFFEHAIRLSEESKEYKASKNKEKMLIFYYTFFEMMTANRSYVLFALQESKDTMKNMTQLKGLRADIKRYATSLIEEKNETQELKFLKHSRKIFSEGAWLQTLFILKFWMDDNSPAFEKTDLVIEKSVRAIFDVFETTPLESLVDFGKFMWKEKMA
jgi:hypothetical protein